jgi:1,4-alpha-glucan branching enzyme
MLSDTPDLLARRTTHFVLWAPGQLTPPQLVIGQFLPGNPPDLSGERRLPLASVAGVTDLWQIAATDCGLTNGEVYHYWFEIDDTQPSRDGRRFRCSDPAAFIVDWRLVGPLLPAPYNDDDRHPAAVIKFAGGRLVPCDPGGEEPAADTPVALTSLPTNNRLVIYELPTAWTRTTGAGSLERAVGSFRDVRALVEHDEGGANFSDLDALQVGRSYLEELGVNALELLPPADSSFRREWGYGTSHYLAPDHDLGFPEGHSSPTALTDLTALTRSCRHHGIRFFVDAVMAFARLGPYQNIAFPQFHIDDPSAHQGDADALTSTRGFGRQEIRNGFGSTLFRFARFITTYDPIEGRDRPLSPARQYLLAHAMRWLRDLGVDGVRLDSVENVANWDFVGDFTNLARALWRQRWASSPASEADARFLVVGEELSLPMALLSQRRLDGLWNDRFRALIRSAMLGEVGEGEPDFESTVRHAIDARALGFGDLTQAVNYLTSHDVEGFRKERLVNFLRSSSVTSVDEVARRIRLAFVCLLTSVGVPMILAGEEFGDEHDRFDEHGNVTQDGGKQVDPVNYSRLADAWRQALLQYVSRLVQLRTAHPALAVNDTTFIHIDLTPGRRVFAWRRGLSSSGEPVVVLANFSDFGTENPASPAAEYVVRNWPATPPGRSWREVTQNRAVPQAWIGREPIFPWEAKVYTLA